MNEKVTVRRRDVLAGVSALGAATALPGTARAVESEEATFFALSRAVTGRPDLDATISARLLVAMKEVAPDYGATVSKLANAVSGDGTPADLLKRADAAGLARAFHELVASWYTGTAKAAMGAPMVAYYDALMYRPTRDALPVPTYCFAEPGWWTQTPPALGIPAVAPKAVTPPAPAPVAVETKPPPTKKVEPHHPPEHR